MTQDIFDGLEAKEPRRAALVLLDFSRAYDKTWKAALYVKLKDLEVPTCMIRWKGFLADRRARVRWNDTLSKERVFRDDYHKGSSWHQRCGFVIATTSGRKSMTEPRTVASASLPMTLHWLPPTDSLRNAPPSFNRPWTRSRSGAPAGKSSLHSTKTRPKASAATLCSR